MEVGLGVVFVPRSYRNYAKTLVSSLSGETHLTLSISCFLLQHYGNNFCEYIYASTQILLQALFLVQRTVVHLHPFLHGNMEAVPTIPGGSEAQPVTST